MADELQWVRITENGEAELPDGSVHGLLPEEPPESPPHNFSADGATYHVDPDQCAAYYRRQGKELPAQVPLHLPDGSRETHTWAGYGHRFREVAQAIAAGQPVPTAAAAALSTPPTATPPAGT